MGPSKEKGDHPAIFERLQSRRGFVENYNHLFIFWKLFVELEQLPVFSSAAITYPVSDLRPWQMPCGK